MDVKKTLLFTLGLLQTFYLWAGCTSNGIITTDVSAIALNTPGCADDGSMQAILLTNNQLDVAGNDITAPIVIGSSISWNLTFQVNSEIKGSANGVAAPDGVDARPVLVTNYGQITVQNSGLLLTGGGMVTNYGSILGDFGGVDISSTDGGPVVSPVLNSQVDNYGTIIGGTTGIHMGLGGTVNNHSGVIGGLFSIQTEESESGITSGPITVNNDALIGDLSTTNTGVLINAGGVVNNSVNHEILAGTYGITVQKGSAVVNNAGTIHASFGRGIYFQNDSSGGTVNNSGLVQGDGTRSIIFTGGPGTITNSGVIQGGLIAAIEMRNGSDSVNNTGIISSTSGHAIKFASGSNNQVTNNGIIYGDVTYNTSHDIFLMGGGSMSGRLLMGSGGNESATFQNISDANIGNIIIFNGGGGGGDQLNFINSQHTGGSDLINWETINLNNAAALTLSNNLVLGGNSSDTTAVLNVNASTLNANNILNRRIKSRVAGNPVLVNNAGTLNIVSSNSNNSLIIEGNYVGNGGLLSLSAVLNSDGSPADKLVIDGVNTVGGASGTTLINVVNHGGTGSLTTGDGILVVEALNNATTTPTAFSLSHPIRVGAYDYQLFRGGLNSTALGENWFLRSTFSRSLPIIGPEISVYSSVMPMTLEMNRLMMGTWHERMGYGGEAISSKQFWVRGFDQSYKEHMFVILDPKLTTNIGGLQAGGSLYQNQTDKGALDALGLYGTYANANQNVRGPITFSNSNQSFYVAVPTGSVNEYSVTLGAYATRLFAAGGYVDLVAQGSYYKGSTQSFRASMPLTGVGTAESIELGYPYIMLPTWTLEPQGQLIYNYAQFRRNNDVFSSVALGSNGIVMGRAGVRLVHEALFNSYPLFPYLRANYWSVLSGNRASPVVYAGIDNITSSAALNWAQLGGGLDMNLKNNWILNAFMDGLVTTTNSTNFLSGVDAGLSVHVYWS